MTEYVELNSIAIILGIPIGNAVQTNMCYGCYLISKSIEQFFIHSKLCVLLTTNIHIRAFVFVRNIIRNAHSYRFSVVTPKSLPVTNGIRYAIFNYI